MGLMKRRRRNNRRKRSPKQKVREGAIRLSTVLSRSVPWLLGLALILSIPVAILFTWEQADKLPIFHVDRVDIEGNGHTERATILDALGYQGPQTNIFNIEPRHSESRLKALPWIKEARVERGLPSRVRVIVKERVVGGLMLLDQLYLIDESGVPFKPVEREREVDQAVVTGSFGPLPNDLEEDDYERIKFAMSLMALYSARGLDNYDRLSEVHVDELTGYALVTEKRRVRVLLGEGRMEQRLARLSDVFEVLEQRKIAVSTIRLDGERMLDRIAVERRGSAQPHN